MIRAAAPSSPLARLGAFAVVLVLVFAGSFGVGRAVGDAPTSGHPTPSHQGPTPASTTAPTAGGTGGHDMEEVHP